MDVAAVAVASFGVFAVDGERASGFGGGEGVKGAAVEVVPGSRGAAGDLGGWAEVGEKRAAVGEAARRDAVGESESGDGEVGQVRVPFDAERVERLAEPAGVLTRSAAAGGGWVGDDPGHGDRRRDRARGRA